MNTNLLSQDKFFKPQGIVVVGASSDPRKLGYNVARNLIQIGFPGTVHFVNPNGGQLFGKPMFVDLQDVPDPVDLAILLAPATATPQALRNCAARGISAVIIVSAGFREAGPEGARLENELIEIARQQYIRIIGPNCIGVLDTHLPLDTTFLRPPPPPKGNIAFISHSGATCAAVIDWSRGQGFGFSRLVSLGNQIDVNETDMLHSIAADPATRSIAMYLESISDGRRFIDTARVITRDKPVIVLKSGRYASSALAAASHTGALAGKDVAYDAAFTQAGIIRANTMEELFEWAHTLASIPPPKDRSIAVLTSAGGLGVAAADALEMNNLRLASLSDNTINALKAILPPFASVNNPIDMLASATSETYASCLSHLLADPQVDGVLMIILPPPLATDKTVAEAVLPIIKSASKPVLSALVGDLLIHDDRAAFHQIQMPVFSFPERAAAAFSILAKRSEYLESKDNTSIPEFSVNRSYIQNLLQENQPGSIANILYTYGIPILPVHLATNQEEITESVNAIGFPVALKIASPDLSHKSDIGGVLLDIKDVQSAHQGYKQLLQRAKAANPEAQIQGVTVQKMAPSGQEVIIGIVQDITFGPMIMFGSGGIEVEGMKDVAFALAPLTVSTAENLLNRTWAGRKLKGYRSIAPADHKAVIEALLRLSQLAVDFPKIHELEINPLRVLSVGQGVIALDIRAVLG